jgi:tetratricopeptide (TPR) repeat protein
VLSRAAARTRNAGRIDESIEHAEAALAIADELDLDDLRIHALGTLGGGRADRGELDGIADMERALALATARGSREATRTAHNLGVQWFLRGDLVRMARYGSEATDFAIRFGDGRLLRWIRGTSTSVQYMLGDWDAAIEATDEYLARGAGEEGYHIPFVRSFRAVIRLARDDVAGALDDVEHALAAVDDSLDPQAQAPPLGLGSVVLMELGDPRGPAVALRAADLRIGYDPEMMTISHLPLLPLPRDVAARIRRAVTEARVETRWTAAGTAALDGRFGDAVEIFSSMPLRPVEARARMRYAEQLAHEGRRGEADAEIERALAFWRSVGATRYVRTAEAQRSAVAVPQDARTADAR